ncbi:hypothetical protein [Agromyces ramosus]|uniref:Lipoprotein n=1 Tax=Agromyces ramosus TaxID=33879 RepID=A0ABU0R5A3_9MICO|nr:hypothetical protein [Agromyces ramosus]MDQ0893269.1 hypothetical protein [Agromyces ramosus]
MKRHLALLALVGVALTACSGQPADAPPTPSHLALDRLGDEPASGNGLWLLGGGDAADEIERAVGDAGTVTYSGEFTELTPGTAGAEPSPGRTLRVEYTGRPDHYAATIETGALRAEVVAVDGRTYLRGNAAYAAHTGIAEVEQGFVCAVSGGSLVEEWAPFLHPRELVADLLEASATLTVQPPQGDAQTLDVVVGSADAPAGVMTVQRTGPPLPGAFTAGDSTGSGSFTFSAWGEQPDVAAPTDPVRACGS